MSIPNYHGHRDPREGEHPDPQDLCDHGVDRHEADCGQCLADDIDATNQGRLLDDAETTAALMQFFRQKLDQIQQREDETMGAALAAREGKR